METFVKELLNEIDSKPQTYASDYGEISMICLRGEWEIFCL